MVVGCQRKVCDRQRALLRWYRSHGRHHLPWRHHITSYRVLVSEVMLQQTQVDRVIPYFNAWVKRWPTAESLARAKRSDVIRAWAGLGYNRRAVYLHRVAQEIVGDQLLRKTFSHSQECENVSGGEQAVIVGRLRELPGVGPYTANAILAFAWNLSAPCVDVNVRRVLAYAIYRYPAIMKMPLAQVERLAVRVIPRGRGRVWNYALMDYGALMLRARDVPKRHRPKPTQGRFENSPRFWRGRIVAVLRGDAHPISLRQPRGGGRTEKRADTVLYDRTKLCQPHYGYMAGQLRRALSAYGAPPPVAPLLAALVRDGVVAKHGARYMLA